MSSWGGERCPSRGCGKKRVPGCHARGSRAVGTVSANATTDTVYRSLKAGNSPPSRSLRSGNRPGRLFARFDQYTGIAEAGGQVFGASAGRGNIPFKLITSLMVAVVCGRKCVDCGRSTRGRERVLRRNEEAPCGALIRACGPSRVGLGRGSQPT